MVKKTIKDAVQKKSAPKLKIVRKDAWLEPYNDAIQGRYDYARRKMEELANGKTLKDFASGHLYFGLHRTPRQWVLREWAPNATEIYLGGECNGWKELPEYAFKRLGDSGNWELKLPAKALHHGDL